MIKYNIIKAMINEKLFNNKNHITQKEINKALNNIGQIYRKDYINKKINELNKDGIIIVKDKSKVHKEYCINKAKCPYNL